MTRDQWILILVCTWVATLFAAILLFVPGEWPWPAETHR
jgi:hypothetical protein